jgi:antitoxin CptB
MEHARIAWQCRRGMLELDILLQAYVELRYPSAKREQQLAFETLLNYPDQLLFDYLLGGSQPSDPGMAYVVQEILSAAQD